MNARGEPEDGSASQGAIPASIELSLSGRRMRLDMSIPRAPVRLAEILPLFRSIADGLMDAQTQSAEATGARISCRKGCGACCRQMVPITRVEAHGLRERIDAMPAPQRDRINERFDEARRRLGAAGLLDAMADVAAIAPEQRQALGLAYFKLGIACPFLEDESCSIHPVRPIACREYLVTSPAEHCSDPSPTSVKLVEVGASVSNALAQLAAGEGDRDASTSRWVPLILALDWAESNPEASQQRPGPDWVRALFEGLSGKSLPGEPGG